VAAVPNKKTPGGADSERAKMMRTLIPAGAIALVVILVAVIASLSGGERKMSDGSNGSADDPDLKEIVSGVRYRDLKEGDGKPCEPGAKVKMNYTGWLTDGTVFDSNKDKAPVEFELSGLIQGWQIGIPGMKPGGKRKLVIAPDKGYREQAKGKIPPNSTLIFEVELISASGSMRPRHAPPTDLTKLSDGTAPNADDPNLKPIGNEGLKYRDLKEGDGEVVPAGAHVVMEYIGWRMSDGGMFDSSWKPESSRPLDISLNNLIAGWQEGVPGMKVGGIRKLVIPPKLAYGNQDQKGIPPNSTLVFEIELLGIR